MAGVVEPGEEIDDEYDWIDQHRGRRETPPAAGNSERCNRDDGDERDGEAGDGSFYLRRVSKLHHPDVVVEAVDFCNIAPLEGRAAV